MAKEKHNFEDFQDQHAHGQDIPRSFQHFRRALLVFDRFQNQIIIKTNSQNVETSIRKPTLAGLVIRLEHNA